MLPDDVDPPAAVLAQVRTRLLTEAAAPIATKPELRARLVEMRKRLDQTIDATSKDEVIFAGHSAEATARAKSLVQSFEQFIAENKDEITALQVLYSRPYAKRLRFADIKALADTIQAPPRSWTPEVLWRAYEALERDRVRGTGGSRLLTDLVSLVRFALHQEDELTPFGERVEARYQEWLAQQANRGRVFTAGAAPVAGPDQGTRRRQPRRRDGRLRLHALRPAGRRGAGVSGVWRRVETAAG